MTRPFSLNRGPDYSTSLRIGRVSRLRKVQYSRLGVSRGPADFPLPSKTEAVSASRKTHTIAQTNLSTGPYYPTSTRIEAGSFSQKAQFRRPFTRSVQQNPHSNREDAIGSPHQYGAAPPQPQRLEHRHSAEQTEWHVRYGQVESSGQQPKKACSSSSIRGGVAGHHVHGFRCVA